MRRRRHDRLAYRNAAGGGDLGADLGPGSTPPRPGLAPWGQLDRDGLDRGQRGLLLELGGVEVAVRRSGTRSSPSRSPRSGRRRVEVIGADRASPVSWANPPQAAPPLSASIALADRAPKLIAETFQQGDVVGLQAVRSRPGAPWGQVGGRMGPQRVPEELVAEGVDVAFGAERPSPFKPLDRRRPCRGCPGRTARPRCSTR